MIVLTKLNGVEFVLNADFIETIYENPDTTIHLTNGNIYIVKEPMREVVQKALDFRRETFSQLLHRDAFEERVSGKDQGRLK